jgi:kynurenine formamidase
MRLVDLSVPLSSGMGHFEGTPPVWIARSHELEDAGYRMSLLVMGNHAGTHLDAPSHFVAEGGGVDTIPLERCFGEAVVCDVTPKADREPVTIGDLERYSDTIVEGARVLIRTDWDTRFGTDAYFEDYPPLAPELADWLAERGVWLLGVDIPSLHPEQAGPMHETLLGERIVIVESLARLRELSQERVLLSALPLNLPGADGAPIRAVAYDGLPRANDGSM